MDMNALSVISATGLIMYALLGALSIALLFFLIRLLIALTDFVRVSCDYWRMRADAQHRALHQESETD
jgi:hypothetical protein